MVRFRPWCVAPVLVLAAGCGDGRDVRDPNTFYACSKATDCVSGFSCVCGWCQAKGSAPLGCDAGATGTDGGSSARDTGSSARDTGASLQDAGSSARDTGASLQDTGSSLQDTGATSPDGGTAAGCNLVTWQGCPAGQGCFWDEANSQRYCTVHGHKPFGASCQHPECGRHGGVPMLCDTVDGKCYDLCDLEQSGMPGTCPAGYKCFGLADSKQAPLPDSVGICAPG